MDVGAYFIDIFKTNTKVLCNNTIEILTKDCPGGSNLVLRSKPMVPRCRPLNSIICKCNARKFLSFIVTLKTGSTQEGIPYLSK